MQSINRIRPANDIRLQSELSQLIADRQQQIATGKKLDDPSDNQVAWSQISDIAKAQADIGGWLRNIDRAQSVSNQAEDAVTQISVQLSRANELLVQASSGTASLESREIIALEMENIGATLSDILSKDDSYGRPLFADTTPISIPIDNDIAVAATPPKSAFADMTTVIADTAAIIRTGDETQRAAMLTSLREQMDNVAITLGQQGVTAKRLEQVQSELQNRQIDFSEHRSALEDTDLTQAISDVQKLLVNLEAAQATFARIEQSTLFDVIR